MQDHRQQPSSGRRRAQGAPWVGLKNHPFFMSASLPTLMVMYPPRRLALPIHNRKQIGGMAAAALAEAFFNGLRFDPRLAVFASIPFLMTVERFDGGVGVENSRRIKQRCDAVGDVAIQPRRPRRFGETFERIAQDVLEDPLSAPPHGQA